MKKFFALLLVAILILTGCAKPPARPTHVVPNVRMEIHADTSFTQSERELILLAAAKIRAQTADFVVYDIIFDLDFSSMDSLRRNNGKNIIVRIPSSTPDLGVETLGDCTVNFNDLDMRNPARVRIVYDRLYSDDIWKHVVMHELLHMIRCQHISDFRSIMYPKVTMDAAVTTCMTQRDLVELCTVHGCDTASTRPCDP